MRFGSIYGSGFGSPSNMLGQPTDARRVRAGTAVEVRLTPAAGFGDAWYGIYIGSRLAGLVYAGEGETTQRQAFPCPSGKREVLILRHGHLEQYDMSRVARRHFAANTAARSTLSWTWPAQVVGVIDPDGTENGDLSGWNLSGLLWSVLEPGASDTRRRLAVDLATSGSDVLLLNCNGTNGSTSFPDSSAAGHAVTAHGDAQVSTAQSKFGGASALFDGTGDYLSVPDSADWDFGAGSWTIDFWVYPTADSYYSGLVSITDYLTAGWAVKFKGDTNRVEVQLDYTTILTAVTPCNLNTWTHVAVVKDASAGTLSIYLDGQLDAQVADNNTYDGLSGADLLIGRLYKSYDNFYLTGYLDDIRITKGAARWTSDFTPPASEAVAGSMATVTLKRYGSVVASGTVSAPGTCTLDEQNDSGISGTVAVGASPTDVTGAALHVRFPQSLRVLRDQTDPPTTIRETVAFNRSDQGVWTEPEDLDPGTYYYRAEYVSDTGDEGAETATSTVTIPGPPEPPTNLAYSSGNAAATVLSFTPSPTSGATYRAYLMQPGGTAINFADPAATAPAGSTSITLPAISGYPGTAYVVVRAVSAGGVEEVNGEVLALEYDASGNYVAPRPNTPAIRDWSVTAGNTLQVTASYDPTDEAGTATQVHLCTRTPSGSYDWTNPDATASLSISPLHPEAKTASLQVTGLADGWHYVAVKAATAAGVQSADASDEVLIYVDATDLSAPAVDIDVSRG